MFHDTTKLVELAKLREELFFTDKQFARVSAYAGLVGRLSVYLTEEQFAQVLESVEQEYESSKKWVSEREGGN